MATCERYDGLKVFEEPVCLIYTGCGEDLILNTDVIEELRKIDQGLDIVGIAGPYRTGKSYLLNRLAGRNTGFSLGSTIQAKTKGIWVWCRPHPFKTDRVLLLMNTEGLGDAEKGSSEHDIWILTLSVLLSSTLVFNILSVMNEDAMQEINLVAEIAKKLSSTTGNETVAHRFPLLILTLRDFSLELIIDGKEITADEYFEHCLKTKTLSSNTTSSDRYSVIECFPRRKCFTFERPGNRRVLKELDRMPDSELDTDFLEESVKFCDYVFNNSQVKQVASSTKVNGPRFVSMVENYLLAIQKGELPNIVSAVDAMSRIENTRAIEEACQLYMFHMTERLELPTDSNQELLIIHNVIVEEAIENFNRHSVLDKGGEFFDNLMTRLRLEFNTFQRMNEEVSIQQCQQVLSELYRPIQQKLAAGAYAEIFGLKKYEEDMETLNTEYQLYPKLGVQAVEVLMMFQADKSTERAMVRRIDVTLVEQHIRTLELKAEIRNLQQEAERSRSSGRQAQIQKERAQQRLRELVQEEERRRQSSLRELQRNFDGQMESALQRQRARLQSQNESELDSLRRQLR